MHMEYVPPRYEIYRGEYPTLSLCRVALQEKGIYTIFSAAGAQPAQVSGKFRHEVRTLSDYPAVGDYVMADLNGGGTAVIREVLPRTSVFLRRGAGTSKTEQVVAANVDTLFLCMALNNDFNIRRLERYLAVAWDSGATPVLLLTKADLCGEPEEKIREAERAMAGADILVTSAVREDGWRAVEPYLVPGKTIAFIGSSGVGKSTMINRLLGEDRLDTNGLRNDDKGRHTTTHRELILLPCGATVIDTPGMRELGMWDAGAGLSAAFGDVEELARGCRFSNCTHRTEPGCAVRAALESGELSADRWQAWLKLQTENRYCEDAKGYQQAKNAKNMKIAMMNRAARKKN